MQDLLNALQSEGSLQQSAGQYADGGAGAAAGGAASGSQSPIFQQLTPDNANLSGSMQSLGGGSQTQALEAAVQQLLNAVEQQNGGQNTLGAVSPSADEAAGAGGGQSADGVAGMGQSITPPDMSGLQVGSTGDQAQLLEQAVQQLLSALEGGGSQIGAAPTIPPGQGDAGGASGATGTDPNATLTSDYNNVMSQLSANGNSAQNIQQAVQQFMQDAQTAGSGTDQNVQTAMTNMIKSLQDGTFSQQGSQGALEGAAERDGMSGVVSESIAGQPGGAAQAAGAFDPAQNQKGALGANAAILESEIANGNAKGGQQITNNATALATEATNQAKADAAAGNTDAAAQDTALASAAQNIANSANGTGDGTYNGAASLQALQNAMPDDSNKLAAQNSASA
ncbi:MAG: hypothetical protein ACRYG8_47265 [Janthinobacterium lividum]